MTFRAVILGILTGLAVACCTYFNDWVVHQTHFVGNLMPISVFGILILLYFIANPLLGAIRPRLAFAPGEMAVIAALGLAVCGWPGSNFFRTFAGVTAMPGNLVGNKANWQASHVLSYVPGGSPQIASGYVRDWPGLADRLVAAEDAAEDAAAPSPAARVWSLIEPAAQYQLKQVSLNREASDINQRGILRGLNEIVEGTRLYDPQAFASVELPAAVQQQIEQLKVGQLGDVQIHRLNRALLAAAFADHIAPIPAGSGLLLAGGQPDPEAVEALAQGWGEKGFRVTPGRIARVPWGTWWPVLRLWLGVGLCMGIASLCLALIVHPQWSHRELLPYPLVRFLDELTQTDPQTQRPRIYAARMFWVAFIIVLLIHVVNGLNAWFPTTVPAVKLDHSIIRLAELFPNAGKVPTLYGLWSVHIYFCVIGFAFFLSSEVALSMGLTNFAWAILGSLLIANGVAVENDWKSASIGPMLRFGGYLGTGLMILYVGRRYYLNVLASAIGVPRAKDTPGYATWAARILMLCLIIAVFLLSHYGNLSWQLGVLLMGLCMLAVLVVARINAEAGSFFIQPSWLPMAILAAVFGTKGLGPEAYIVMALLSVVLVGDPREAMMPYLTNGLRAGEVMGRIKPRTTGGWIAVMVLVGLAVSLVVTLTVQYSEGLTGRDAWGNRVLPIMPFDALDRQLSDLTSSGDLTNAMQLHGWGHFTSMKPEWGALGWAGIGLALVLGCAVARLRLSRWPLHPVIFLMWGTMPGTRFAWSFLIGWLAKTAVIKLGGSKSYQKVVPVAVGMIAGEILAAIIWLIVGWIYYAVMGTAPTSYRILPG